MVATARQQGCSLEIRGYTNANGDVSDYTVAFLANNGYDDLVERSHAKLQHLLHKEGAIALANAANIPLDKVAPAQVETWANEMLASYEKRMTTPPEERAVREQAGVSAHPNGYWVKDGSEVTILRGLRLIQKTTRYAGKQASNTWGKTRVKNHIVNLLPIGDYIGQMNLDPEKLEGVSLVASPGLHIQEV